MFDSHQVAVVDGADYDVAEEVVEVLVGYEEGPPEIETDLLRREAVKPGVVEAVLAVPVVVSSSLNLQKNFAVQSAEDLHDSISSCVGS